MSGTLILGQLHNALPLPGVGEMRDVVKGMISHQANGYEENQCESLCRRFDGLIVIAETCKELENVTEILGELEEMKSRFETNIKRKSRLPGILRAQERLQACESLSRELTDLMERIQFQSSVSAQISVNQRRIEDNFAIINAPNLLCDEQELYTWSSQSWFPVHTTGTNTYYHPVLAIHQFGRIGAMRIVYKSFSSSSDHRAKSGMAKEELKDLSRIRHRNVAAIVGVTKGYDGLDGFVVGMEGALVKEFLSGSVSGGALALCMQGLQEAHEFLWRSHKSFTWDGNGVTVAPDGRVTVLPCHSFCNWISPEFENWAMSTTVHEALRIYRLELCRSKDQPRHKSSPSFIGALMNLGRSHLTELRLLKILADCALRPFGTPNNWRGCALPPFTVRAGDLGFIEDAGKENTEWKVLNLSSDTDENVNGTEFEWEDMCRAHPHPQYK
ncbi:hypothetical protein BDV93DRAFT_557861 [Ceratobasidium sp. AG-I]|nr:hypothetical protein BDV93DRAFT_557861 [Ceratobasidium sp. AG-I]